VPRTARRKSQSGIYHIMLRGINKQTIFFDNEDMARLHSTILRFKKTSDFQLYAYCFMPNHIHLLIREVQEPISRIMQKISISYVFWYNQKYERCGHLFQERYKSEVVEDDQYFLTLLRYIHQNPLKSGLVQKVEDYRWSSMKEYQNASILVDTEFPLNMFGSDKQKARRRFLSFINEPNNDRCRLDDDFENDLDPVRDIKDYLQDRGISKIDELLALKRVQRNAIITELKLIEGVSCRDIADLTGLSKSTISRISSKKP
jgi:putative transposase